MDASDQQVDDSRQVWRNIARLQYLIGSELGVRFDWMEEYEGEGPDEQLYVVPEPEYEEVSQAYYTVLIPHMVQEIGSDRYRALLKNLAVHAYAHDRSKERRFGMPIIFFGVREGESTRAVQAYIKELKKARLPLPEDMYDTPSHPIPKRMYGFGSDARERWLTVGSRCRFLVYRYRQARAHVGIARAAIAYFMLGLTPYRDSADLPIMTADDRRYLNRNKNRAENKDITSSINHHIAKMFMTVRRHGYMISPIGRMYQRKNPDYRKRQKWQTSEQQMSDSKYRTDTKNRKGVMKGLTDIAGEQFRVNSNTAQILVGNLGLFVNGYLQGLEAKDYGWCASFAKIFEDSAYSMLVSQTTNVLGYVGLVRMDTGAKTEARKDFDPDELNHTDRQCLQAAIDISVQQTRAGVPQIWWSHKRNLKSGHAKNIRERDTSFKQPMSNKQGCPNEGYTSHMSVLHKLGIVKSFCCADGSCPMCDKCPSSAAIQQQQQQQQQQQGAARGRRQQGAMDI